MLGTVTNVQTKVSGVNGADSLRTEYFYWSTDGVGNPFVAQKQTLLDGGKSYQQNSYVFQALNNYGSVTRTTVYDYTNSATPIRIYETSHIADAGSPNQSEYADSRYIRDRVVNVVVKNQSTSETGTLVSNATYDTANACDTTAQPTVVQIMHDSNYNTGNKGNKTGETTPQGTSCWMYDVLGNVFRTAGPGVPTTAISTNINSNYSVPGQIQISGDAASISSFQFNNWMGLTNVAAPNGANSALTYDTLGRPIGSVSPLSVHTGYYYYPDPFPNSGFFPTFSGLKSGQLAITEGRHWTRTTLDGLGRTVRVESGDTTDYSTSKSIVDTQYGPCACSPMGKMVAVSQPYKTGETPVFTRYYYDAVGRTTKITAPGGLSNTTLDYQGNTTRVTDAAGKWKTTTRDVQGNTVLVTEPDPGSQASSTRCDTRPLPPIAGGTGALQTCYTYDTLEHLTNVTMPRSTATQTRPFTFDPATQALASEKNPETGLSCYFYKADSSGRGHSLLDKVVAKGSTPGASYTDGTGKMTQYLYDAYSRVTQIKRTPEGQAEDLCQRTNFFYDLTALAGGNAWGRLGQSSTGDSSCTVIAAANGFPSQQRQYVEQYSYNSLGQVVQKRLKELASSNSGTVTARNWDMMFNYSATAEKLLDNMRYPDTQDASGTVTQNGYTVNYGYDLMSRQNGMTYTVTGSPNPNPLVVTGATYNGANQLRIVSMSYNNTQPVSQERTYNALNQLESVYFNGNGAWGYEYPANQNNGQISVLHDFDAGQTISYGYDSLKRLATATAVAGPTTMWSQANTFDGFGNLTAKTGSLPQTMTTDPTTNQLSNACPDKYGNTFSSASTNCAVAYSRDLYTYDVSNRIATGLGPNLPGDVYLYNAANKRVAVVKQNGQEQLFFYGPGGNRLATINGVTGGVREDVYFAGSLWIQGLAVQNLVKVDRLGSVRGVYFGTATPTTSYLPFGEELNPTSNDRQKFGTYTRDSVGGLDYADQRFYNSAFGRFMTADPYAGSAWLEESGSWNRYSFALSDPVNEVDSSGLCSVVAGGFLQSPSGTNAEKQQAFADSIEAIASFPYSDQSFLANFVSVIQQDYGVPNSATANLLSAIALAAQSPGQIDLFAFSGSAQTVATALGLLNADVRARIGNITYLSPGSASFAFLPSGTGKTLVFGDSKGIIDNLIKTGAPFDFINTNCGHDANCIYENFSEQLAKRSSGACTVGSGSTFGLPLRTFSTFSPSNLFSGPLFLSIDPGPPRERVTSTISFH